jgi:hypothetical protein
MKKVEQSKMTTKTNEQKELDAWQAACKRVLQTHQSKMREHTIKLLEHLENQNMTREEALNQLELLYHDNDICKSYIEYVRYQ